MKTSWMSGKRAIHLQKSLIPPWKSIKNNRNIHKRYRWIFNQMSWTNKRYVDRGLMMYNLVPQIRNKKADCGWYLWERIKIFSRQFCSVESKFCNCNMNKVWLIFSILPAQYGVADQSTWWGGDQTTNLSVC